MWGKYISLLPRCENITHPRDGNSGSSTQSEWNLTFVTDARRRGSYQNKKIWGTQKILSTAEACKSTTAVCSAEWTKGTVPSQTRQLGFPLCFSNITFSVCYYTHCNQRKGKIAEMPLYTRLFQRMLKATLRSFKRTEVCLKHSSQQGFHRKTGSWTLLSWLLCCDTWLEFSYQQ